jgi:hypothetical protein
VRKLKGDPKTGTRFRDARGRIGGGASSGSEAQETMSAAVAIILLRTHS